MCKIREEAKRLQTVYIEGTRKHDCPKATRNQLLEMKETRNAEAREIARERIKNRLSRFR